MTTPKEMDKQEKTAEEVRPVEEAKAAEVPPPPRPLDEGNEELLKRLASGRRRLIAFGFLLVFGGFGGLGAWAALAPLQSAVVAGGTVKVASERKTVQHLEGGIISEILVKEGDRVNAGDVLIRLDDTTPRARVQLLQSQLDRLLANRARLEAEQAGLDEITFPEELLERQDDEKIAGLLAAERKVFESRRESLQGEKQVLEQRGRQFAEQIDGLKTQIRSTTVQLGTIREEKDAVEILYKKGVYEKPRYLELKRAMARLNGQIGSHRSSIAQVEERIGEVKLRMIELDKKRTEEVNTQLQKVQSDIFDSIERLRAAEETLKRISITAPTAGTVVGLSVHTVGGVIRGGTEILGIIPKGDTLVIEAQVKPQDIDLVHEGLKAEVLLTAFNRRTTPMMPGKVTRVSADSFASDVGAYYLIRVEIDPEHVTDLQLYPGMPAEVYLLTGERTALSYILTPIETSLRRALREE